MNSKQKNKLLFVYSIYYLEIKKLFKLNKIKFMLFSEGNFSKFYILFLFVFLIFRQQLRIRFFKFLLYLYLFIFSSVSSYFNLFIYKHVILFLTILYLYLFILF